MPGDELGKALLKPEGTLPVTLREEVEELCSETRNRLLALITSRAVER
jgi:hypothetical protein